MTNTTSDFGIQMNLPDMRNGDAENIRALVAQARQCRPALPEAYHWVPIVGLTAGAGVTAIGPMVRATEAMLTAHNPDAWTPAKIRKGGLIIGTALAMTAVTFGIIGGDDLNRREVAPAIYRYTPATPAVAATPTAAAVPAVEAHYDLVDGVNAALAQTAQAAGDFTALERSYIATMLRMGIAALPLAAYSVAECGHHYLSDQGVKSASFRAAYAVEKQVLVGTEVKEWANADMIANDSKT